MDLTLAELTIIFMVLKTMVEQAPTSDYETSEYQLLTALIVKFGTRIVELTKEQSQ